RCGELGLPVAPVPLPPAGGGNPDRPTLHQRWGAAAPGSATLPRSGGVRWALHPVPTRGGADRRAGHGRNLALGGHAGERAHQPGVGSLGAGPDRPRRRRRARAPHDGRDRAGRWERGPGDPELDRGARHGAGLEGRDPSVRARTRMDHGLRDRVDAPMKIKTSYALNKFLTSVAKQHATRERIADEELAGHELTADERAALQAGDIPRLYHLGANPYLIRRVFRPRFRV